jgi:5-methylcytosine-specific restriction endonuclease McrA
MGRNAETKYPEKNSWYDYFFSEVTPMLDLKNISILHQEALRIARVLSENEYLMIEVLQKIDDQKIYRFLKFKSLFQYATLGLRLSDERAYNFIRVARKAREVSKLQEALKTGQVTLSKARKITSVISNENADQWISLCKTLSQRQLERSVARLDPKSQVQEGTRFISETLLELKAVISVETEQMLKRVEDLLSQSAGRPVSKNEVLQKMAQVFLAKNDPVEKAKRILVRKLRKDSRDSDSKKDRSQRLVPTKPLRLRKPIAAMTKHEASLRDDGKCQARNPDGTRCNDSRWVDLHHVIPVSHGGENTLKNLLTLCRGHHELKHFRPTDQSNDIYDNFAQCSIGNC